MAPQNQLYMTSKSPSLREWLVYDYYQISVEIAPELELCSFFFHFLHFTIFQSLKWPPPPPTHSCAAIRTVGVKGVRCWVRGKTGALELIEECRAGEAQRQRRMGGGGHFLFSSTTYYIQNDTDPGHYNIHRLQLYTVYDCNINLLFLGKLH